MLRSTLFDILLHRTGSKLDWATRYTIAVGVAQGLALMVMFLQNRLAPTELQQLETVYSFGVVLLELLTDKPAVSGGNELTKSVFIISNQRNRWGQVLDPSVSETSVSVRNQMLAVLEVALACISTSPETRPNTITVLQMLLSRRLYN